MIVLALIAGGLLGTLFFYLLWKKDRFPISFVIFCGVLAGCPFSLFAVVGANHYFRSNEKFEIKTDIIRSGNNTKKSGNCHSVYVVAKYDGIEHEVDFPCNYWETIKECREVRLTLSKGLFGYYVIERRELVEETISP